MADFRVDGLSNLLMRINQIPDRLAKNAIKSGIRKGANIIRDQARANFDGAGGPNELTGALRSSIRVVDRRGTSTRVTASIVAGTLTAAQTKKFGADSAFYALWVEKGHINRKMNDALRGTRRFVVHQRAISESNTPAYPYMRPAVEQKGAEAIEAVAEAIAAGLAGDAS